MPENNTLVEQIFEAKEISVLKEPLLHAELVSHINNLILHHFEDLIYLLYRVDVNEQKLKILLRENNKTDAANIIASLIIERQIEKIKSRRDFRQDDNIIDEQDRW